MSSDGIARTFSTTSGGFDQSVRTPTTACATSPSRRTATPSSLTSVSARESNAGDTGAPGGRSAPESKTVPRPHIANAQSRPASSRPSADSSTREPRDAFRAPSRSSLPSIHASSSMAPVGRMKRHAPGVCVGPRMSGGISSSQWASTLANGAGSRSATRMSKVREPPATVMVSGPSTLSASSETRTPPGSGSSGKSSSIARRDTTPNDAVVASTRGRLARPNTAVT
ncbi:MAG: hypothetical protein K8M05_19600 [Deltaproteobacteria bacterium]|nr:hypothetical protein [Kofleriaceae bacterium]